MKTLISGANGFLGGHLAKRLKEMGWEVIAVPRTLLGQIDELRVFLEKENPDYIFHLAAYGNHGSQKDEQEIFKANVVGTWNMLLASKNIDYKAFINVGSSSEYGHKKSPMRESDIPETDFFYGASKVAGTYLSRACAIQFNKPIVTIRPFSVYGEGEADFRFIPTMVKHMVNKTEMPFVASPTHDWVYISDFIDAVGIIASHAKDLKGRVVNIGTGIAITNKEVVKIMSYVTEVGVKTKENLNKKVHDSSLWAADNTLLKSLGWEQKVTLSEGLKRCYGYYKQRFKT